MVIVLCRLLFYAVMLLTPSYVGTPWRRVRKSSKMAEKIYEGGEDKNFAEILIYSTQQPLKGSLPQLIIN